MTKKPEPSKDKKSPPSNHTEIIKKLEKIPEEKRAQIIAHFWPSETPPPAFLEAYDKLNPGYAKRFLDNFLNEAERQPEHRRKCELEFIELEKKKLKQVTTARITAVFVVLVILAVGVLFMLKGHAEAGATVITATIVGIAGVFLAGQRSSKDKE